MKTVNDYGTYHLTFFSDFLPLGMRFLMKQIPQSLRLARERGPVSCSRLGTPENICVQRPFGRSRRAGSIPHPRVVPSTHESRARTRDDGTHYYQNAARALLGAKGASRRASNLRVPPSTTHRHRRSAFSLLPSMSSLRAERAPRGGDADHAHANPTARLSSHPCSSLSTAAAGTGAL